MKLFKIMLVGLITFMNTVTIHQINALHLENERYKLVSYRDITRKGYTSNLGRDAYAKDFVSCLYHEGKWLYCVENGVRIEDGATYGTSNPESFFENLINRKTTGLQKRKLLGILMLYAPQSYNGKVTEQSKETYIRYAAATTLAWEITDEVRNKEFQYIGADVGKTAPIDGTGFVSKAVKEEFMSYYKDYESKVFNFLKTPSFSHRDKDKSSTYDLLYDYVTKEFYTELIDTHNTLENYEIIKEGYNITKKGNKVRISTKQKLASSKAISFEVKDSEKHLSQALIVYEASNKKDQKQISAGKIDKPQIQSYFNLKPKYGSLEIIKTNNRKEFVDGAIFSLTDKNSFQQEILVKDGKIEFDYLKPGIYFLKEKTAPEGYLIDTTEYKVIIKENQKTSQTVENDEPLGKVVLKKQIDDQDTQGLQGDSYLENNIYGLYAKEDIYNCSKTKKYYSKGECVALKKTDIHGNIIWKNLPLGKYFILEKESNESLVLNTQPIDVTVNYINDSTSLVEVSKTTKNKVAKQRIRIFKSSIKDGKPGIVEGLKGAEFTFKLNDDVMKLGYANAKTYYKGTTDDNGYLTTNSLPYGKYYVKETKTPEGYYGASDFHITVSQDESLYDIGYQIQNIVVNNIPFESLLKIVKKDKVTGKVVKIPGATFKIKNLETNKYISYIDYSSYPHMEINQWTTHEDGTIILNTKLSNGKYQLEEIAAPTGYLLNSEPVLFEVNDDYEYEIFEDQKTPIIVIEFSNKPVTGQIEIIKEGEKLSGFKEGQFIYEKGYLENVKFGIYAARDILDSSGDSTVLYSKGDLIEEVVSNDEGYALSHFLPLGKYVVKELETPQGYISNEKEYFVDLEYQNQTTAIVKQDVSVLNLRQTFNVQVHKKDQQSKTGLQGASFAVKAVKDIYNTRGEVIVSKGEILEILESNEQGAAISKLDLPVDLTSEKTPLVSIEELYPPLGYIKQNTLYYINTSYQANQSEVVFVFEFLNPQTRTRIHKIDAFSKESLKGAQLQIVDSETKEVVHEFESKEKGVLIEGLHIQKDYILQEREAPHGYTIGEPMTFQIQDTYDIQDVYFKNKKIDKKIETGDSKGYIYYAFLGSICAIVMLLLTKKEER